MRIEAARAPIVLFVAGRERKRWNCAWRLLPFLRAAAQVHWIRVFLSPGPPACARGDGRERGARLSEHAVALETPADATTVDGGNIAAALR